MKKELLLAAMMSTTVSTQLSAQSRSDLVAESVLRQLNYSGSVFYSKDTFDSFKWERQNDDYVKVPFKAIAKISIIEAGVRNEDYTFDGDADLDYEVIFEEIDAATGEVTGNLSDFTYFAKHAGGSKYDIFDCDSTSTCTQDYKSKFYIIDTPEGKILKLKPNPINLEIGLKNTVVFYESK